MSLLPSGTYRYELRRGGVAYAFEAATVSERAITASKQEASGRITHQIDATLDDSGAIAHFQVRYASSLFRRDASYRADGENFRGTLSAMAGRNEIVIKRGRFGEVDIADLVICRALIVARVKARGQTRWTGRVAVVEPNSLVAAAIKQTCRLDPSTGLWIYEARMGEVEELKFDEAGKITCRRDSRGREDVLVAFTVS